MDEKEIEAFIDGLKYHLNRILDDVKRFEKELKGN